MDGDGLFARLIANDLLKCSHRLFNSFPFFAYYPLFLADLLSVTQHCTMCGFGRNPFVRHLLTCKNPFFIEELDMLWKVTVDLHFNQESRVMNHLLVFGEPFSFEGDVRMLSILLRLSAPQYLMSNE